MTARNSVGMEIGQLLAIAHKRAARTFAASLAPIGLDGRLFGVLSAVGRLGAVTQSRLVSELDGDKSTMMRTVDELEQLGLVERQSVPGDRRARAVALTDAGRDRLADARAAADRVAGDLFAAMSTPDQVALRDLLASFLRAQQVPGEAGAG